MESKEAIQLVNYKNVQHLSREQLRKRSWGQFIAYTIGVLTLGVAACIITCFAHITLIPLIYQKAKGRPLPLMTKLSRHRGRLKRYFKVYTKKQAAA